MRGTEYAQLTAFLEIAECRSFAKAAVRLGVARPSLSENMRALEERLGVRLLDRTTRSVTPTVAGERLLTRLRPLFDGLSEATDEASAFRGQSMGTLRLTMMRIAGPSVVPILTRFLAQHPAITLEVSVDDRADSLNPQIDAGITFGETIGLDMVTVPVGPERRPVIVASPGYLAGHPRPIDPWDLAGHNCVRYIRPDSGEIGKWQFEKGERRLTLAVTGTLIANDPQLILAAIQSGFGIGRTTEDYVAASLATGQLVPLLEDWAPIRSGSFLFYSRQRPVSVPLQALIDFIQRQSRITFDALPSNV